MYIKNTVVAQSKTATVLTRLRYKSKQVLLYWVINKSTVCLSGTDKHCSFPGEIGQYSFSHHEFTYFWEKS